MAATVAERVRTCQNIDVCSSRPASCLRSAGRRREPLKDELANFGEDELAAEAAIRTELATLDAADSAIIIATDQAGQLRYNGRKELLAIDALERDALDPSETQSATAILDKISGAGLIGARQ